MKIQAHITLVDAEMPMPEYKTIGAAAFDLYARNEVVVLAGEIAYIPLNVIITPPSGFWTMFAARSSLHKRGLMMVNSVAVMDADFCGPKDEYRAALYNFSQKEVVVERGERIVQAFFMPLHHAELIHTQDVSAPSRGGFGTTGRQ